MDGELSASVAWALHRGHSQKQDVSDHCRVSREKSGLSHKPDNPLPSCWLGKHFTPKPQDGRSPQAMVLLKSIW